MRRFEFLPPQAKDSANFDWNVEVRIPRRPNRASQSLTHGELGAMRHPTYGSLSGMVNLARARDGSAYGPQKNPRQQSPNQ